MGQEKRRRKFSTRSRRAPWMLLLTNQRNDLCEYLSVIGHQKIILCPVRGQHLSIFRVSEDVLDARNYNNELDRTKSIMGFTTFSVWKTKKNPKKKNPLSFLCDRAIRVSPCSVCVAVTCLYIFISGNFYFSFVFGYGNVCL